MEYVLITCAVVGCLVGLNKALISPSGESEVLFNPAQAAEGRFGTVGDRLVSWHKQFVDGIARPTP